MADRAVRQNEGDVLVPARGRVDVSRRGFVERQHRGGRADVNQDGQAARVAIFIIGMKKIAIGLVSARRVELEPGEAVLLDAAHEEVESIFAPARIDAGKDLEATAMSLADLLVREVHLLDGYRVA